MIPARLSEINNARMLRHLSHFLFYAARAGRSYPEKIRESYRRRAREQWRLIFDAFDTRNPDGYIRHGDPK